MNWSQKIYFNDKSIVLTTDKAAYMEAYPASEADIFFTGATLKNFKLAQQQLEETALAGAIIEDNSEHALLEQLHAIFHSIDAAGGVAFNEHGEILMIYRRGKWDLPKGKRDEGETMEECALREVKEETGLKNLTIAKKLGDTYHIYSQYGEQILKRTAWYKMKGSSNDKLSPQKEENIQEARWVGEQYLGPLAAQSYEAVREVLQLAGLKY